MNECVSTIKVMKESLFKAYWRELVYSSFWARRKKYLQTKSLWKKPLWKKPLCNKPLRKKPLGRKTYSKEIFLKEISSKEISSKEISLKWWLKLFAAQIHIPNIYKSIPLKYLKILVFCQNNGWLGTYNGKICPESSTENTPNTLNTPQFIWPTCPNRPIIWDTLTLTYIASWIWPSALIILGFLLQRV